MNWWKRIMLHFKPPTPPPPPQPPGVVWQPPTVNGLIVALNAERAAHGQAALTVSPGLVVADMAHAKRMAAVGKESHDGFGQRVASTYPGHSASENVAYGSDTVAGVMTQWMNSPPHRADILGDFNAVGIGFAKSASGVWYWCTTFVKV